MMLKQVTLWILFFYAARQQSDSLVDQPEKMEIWGYFALRPELE